MWLGIDTRVRALIYLIAVLLAFTAGGFRLRVSKPGALFFVCGGLYILTALFSSPVPELVKNDIRNILVGLACLATLNLSQMTRPAWKHLQRSAHRTVMVVSSVGAVLGLAKLIYFNAGGIVPWLLDNHGDYPMGSSLRIDYNFYSLPLLLGVLSAFWIIRHDSSSRWCTAALLSLPELIASVLLSGSRRGLLTIALGVPALVGWLVFSFRANRTRRQVLRIPWKWILTGLSLAVLCCILKADSLSAFFDDLTSADSFSRVMSRWETFENGTYSDSRVEYWTVALVRIGRFRPIQYVFGEGFDYITDLGATEPDPVGDYPHNFLLSSMLYGGLVQTLILLMMVWLSWRRLWQRSQDSRMFALWFGLVLLFVATSLNSFFSSEIAVFLSVFGLSVRNLGLKTSSFGAVARAATLPNPRGADADFATP